MSNTTKIETLKILAKGINPVTSEVLPENSSFNKPEVIREVFDLIESSTKNNTLPQNQGTPWTKVLKEELAKMYSEGVNIKELASHFGRTSGAIKSELRHQGLA